MEQDQNRNQNNSTSSPLSDIPDHVKEYVKTQVAYYKLEAAEKLGGIAANAIVYTALALLGYLFLLFISLTAAVGISAAIGKAYSGFLIVAGFYLLLAVLLFVLKRKMIEIPIINAIITKMANSNDKEESNGTEQKA